MKEIQITNQEENQRLDKYLCKFLNDAPKSFIYKMLRKKRIKRNGKKAIGNELLQDGDTLQLYLGEETVESFQTAKEITVAPRHFGIVYEDENILAVNKPAGLLTHPENPSDCQTLIHQVWYYLYENGQYDEGKGNTFTPSTANRLDRNTGGIVLIGKNLKALQALNEAMQARTVDKRYLVMVKGEWTKDQTLNGWIHKKNSQNQSYVSSAPSPNAKQIETQFHCIAYSEGYSLLEAGLVTGRSHQIRAQLAAKGFPVVGDRKYGLESTNTFFRRHYGLNNQFLFAHKVIWTQEQGFLGYLSKVTLQAPLPEFLKTIERQYFQMQKGG